MKLDSDEVILDISEEIPKTNLMTTTSHSLAEQQLQEDSGQLKSKTRIIEPAVPSNSQMENIAIVSTTDSPTEILESLKAASPVTTRTPLSPGEANDDDKNGHFSTRKRPENLKVLFITEFSLFVCISLLLILSATTNKLKDKKIWSLELWKWCVVGLAIFSGRLFSECLVNIVVFLIGKNLLIGKEAVSDRYFYSMLKRIWVLIWLVLISSTWGILTSHRVSRSNDKPKALEYITRGLFSTFFVAGGWILGTLSTRLLYFSLYNKIFSKRIEENSFHQYILQTLSGPPVWELSNVRSSRLVTCSGSNVVDLQNPQRIKRRMIEIASQNGFYTLSNTLDKSKGLMNPDEQNNRNITTECEAKAASDLIFRNVAKPGNNYIEVEDLLRFMNKEEVDVVLSLIKGKEESGRINEKSFLNWVVSMYMKSKFLEHSLNDIEEAINGLHQYVIVLLVVVLIILWVILMRIARTQVLLFIAAQFLLACFTLGTSAKSTFEALILVFLKHPFDVGDRCVIDGLQVVVEEVSILTTVFLRYDNEIIYYPNSILASKPISNYNRSPEMRDTVEFDLDVSTPVENISALKAKIKTYIDSKPHLWRPKHSVRVREIEGVNKMKMRLYITHTINFQDYDEKSDRRSNLVLELRNIFQQLGIKYHILPPTNSY